MQSTSSTAKRTRAESSDLNLREEPKRTWRSSQLVQITFRSPRAQRPRVLLGSLFQLLHVTSYSWGLRIYIPEEVEHQGQKELASCRPRSPLLRHKALGLIYTYLVGSRSSATKLVLLPPKAPAVTHEALRME